MTVKKLLRLVDNCSDKEICFSFNSVLLSVMAERHCPFKKPDDKITCF